MNIIFLFQTDRFVGQFCLTQVVLSEIVFAVYIYRIRKLMNQKLLVDVIVQSLDLRFRLFDMNKCTLDRRAVASDGIGDDFPVHADATHGAVNAFAVAEQPVDTFFFIVNAVETVVVAAFIEPFFMKFLDFFDISAAECLVDKTAFVLAEEGID